MDVEREEKFERIKILLINKYNRFVYFFRKRLLPEIVWQSKFTFFILFSLVIFFLTKKGLGNKLTTDYQNLFGVLTSTIGTIVAIFFTLILLPLSQIANKYSPKFLKYLRKDFALISIFLYSIATLIYCVVFLFIGASYQIALSAIILFILLIILLGYLVLYVIWLLDVNNSILTPSHREIVKNFRKMIPKYKRECDERFRKNLGSQYKSDLGDICFLSVDERATNEIQESLLPIREVAIKSIKDQDLEQAKNSIQSMMSVIVIYLFTRKQYYSDDDPLMYFLYTEYKLISQASNNELKLRLHQFIVKCWRLVGIQASIVDVKRLKRIGENLNSLVLYPVKGLKELCISHFGEMDSYVPGNACEALGDIGAQLMNEGYDHQAAIIVQELENISILARGIKLNNVSGSANYAIMRIYAAGVSLRNIGSKDEHNLPYRLINKSIENILQVSLKDKLTTFDNMVLSPFIGSMIDPFRGINLSRISEYGIFSPNLNKFALEMNFANVGANIKVLKESLKAIASQKDWYFSDQALENIYRILLNLLSYINEKMAKDHILYYKDHPFIDDELQGQCEEIIIDGVKILIELAISKADEYLFEDDHLNILFSFYLIILYEYKISSNEKLKDLFEEIHKLLTDLLNEYKELPNSDNNDKVYKYYRLLTALLKENNYSELADDFSVPEFKYRSGGLSLSHESQYPETIFQGQWTIKRPGFQRNTFYYNKIEKALKLNTLNFY